MTEYNIQIFKSIIEYPFTHFFLSHLCYCERCALSRIEVGEYNYFFGGSREGTYAYTDNYLSSDSGFIKDKKEHQLIAQKISK